MGYPFIAFNERRLGVMANIVTKEDYMEYSGVDLDVELASRAVNDLGDNPSERFINAIENWCKSFLMENYSWDGIVNSGNQYNRFKKAIMYQIEHILTYGNLSIAEKFVETGQIITAAELSKINLSDSALTEFRLGGMANFRRC